MLMPAGKAASDFGSEVNIATENIDVASTAAAADRDHFALVIRFSLLWFGPLVAKAGVRTLSFLDHSEIDLPQFMLA
jgi:hypothetical protein